LKGYNKMQKSLIRLSIALLISFAAMVAFGAWNNCRAQRVKNPPSAAAKIPTVSYCDLIRHPARYNKKVLRITATYFVGVEAAALEDFRCDEDRSIWIDYDDSYKSCTKKEVEDNLDKILGPFEVKTENSVGLRAARYARVTFVGRFEAARKFNWRNRDRVFNNGFGHANQYPYRLVAQCLEQASRAN
jgi:hypothetical protein